MVATTQVLNTVELLETILLALPILDALRGQRVCKLWHTTTTCSISLQRALFLEPITALLSLSNTKKPPPVTLISLSTPCYQVLSGSATLKSLLPCAIAHSSKSVTVIDVDQILDQLKGSRGSASSKWSRILLTQPPLTSTTFLGNYTPEEVDDPADSQVNFCPSAALESRLVDHLSGQSLITTHGKQFGLGAIRIERGNGLTFGDVLLVVRYMQTKFEDASLKGETLRMCWVAAGTQVMILNTAISFWEDVRGRQIEKMSEKR